MSSEPAQITINGATFSRYECQVACAIKLWIKNANSAVPSDETLGYIVNSLRGKVNGTAMPCQNIMPQIQRHSQEGVRSIYMSVYVNKSYWNREASRVYYAWLKQNDNIVKRLKATGALAPFLNPDGTLKTQASSTSSSSGSSSNTPK
ncbi:hypothetical protein HO173_008073 [Letharia columbiana]|uniref:Uncharacterized protein n=1 Tax=Letharia columbiana TaxID=112416 RepID=A0A8H6L395_9LECA|nr:uncharacterized protein HO173_008073 [Letharia columbiana]KAF6233861.1 hypothetical protein HO173_008073 [Letharia columbiana]